MLLLSNYENRRKHNNDDSTRPTVNDNDISLLFPYFFLFFEKMPIEWKSMRGRERWNEWESENECDRENA